MNAMNGPDPAATVVPTPATLVGLIEQLYGLGDREWATVTRLASRLGVPRPTLIRWAKEGRGFGSEHLALAAESEARLRERLEQIEGEAAPASRLRPRGEGARQEADRAGEGGPAPSEGDDGDEPEKAAGEAPEPSSEAGAGASKTDDYDKEWARRQQQYGAVSGQPGRDARTTTLHARFDEALERLREAIPRVRDQPRAHPPAWRGT
jgi:hypothetical protein